MGLFGFGDIKKSKRTTFDLNREIRRQQAQEKKRKHAETKTAEAGEKRKLELKKLKEDTEYYKAVASEKRAKRTAKHPFRTKGFKIKVRRKRQRGKVRLF